MSASRAKRASLVQPCIQAGCRASKRPGSRRSLWTAVAGRPLSVCHLRANRLVATAMSGDDSVAGVGRVAVPSLFSEGESALKHGMAPDESILDVVDAYVSCRLERHDPPRVEDLARDLGVSRSHLTRVIRKHSGLSASEYVKRRQIAVAQEWLRSPDLSIERVGRLVGFSSSAGFVRRFRRIVGMNPGEFRCAMMSRQVAEVFNFGRVGRGEME